MSQNRYRGLSPHRRGNPLQEWYYGKAMRSIPAQAGEPKWGGSRRRPERVYPRTGGGTSSRLTEIVDSNGLSPHRRGNRQRTGPRPRRRRSIPAQAGEPPVSVHPADSEEVYPRTGGGTAGAPCSRRYSRGLSPHRRGNLAVAVRRAPARGSIPAQAGEPSPSWPSRSGIRVYPRTGGGTSNV